MRLDHDVRMGQALAPRSFLHSCDQIERLVGIQHIGERYPIVQVRHRVDWGIGQNRPPEEEIEVWRDARDLAVA